MQPARSPAPKPHEDRLRQLDLLVQAVADYAIFLLDREGHVLTWNRGAERIKGYTAEDIVGEHFRRFYPAEERERRKPEDALRVAAREGRYEEEGWRVRKDGSLFWANVLITAVRDERGELLGFGKVTRDLTARRLAEEQLRVAVAELRAANEQVSQFRHLVAGVRDYAIFMLDPGGYVTTWNAGAEHIKQYSADEIIGRHFSTFYTAEDRLRRHPADELTIATREGRYEEEGWRVRKDGTRFWASVTITALRNEYGVLVGFAKVTRDLSDRRAAEEELLRAHERLERSNVELERFAAVAAHDLLEPLRTVGSFADLLYEREAHQLSADGTTMLEHITGSATRMQTLVEDLLRYARMDDALTAEPVRLAPAVDRVLEGLQRLIAERNATVEVDLPADISVLADQTGVDALLQNLIANAVKFAGPDGPRVKIAAECVEDRWRVTVTDNGPGIDAADRERIFAAFQRLPQGRAASGSGLGLAICRRAVERAGGEIGVEPAPGGGSIFWFELRAAP